MRHISNVILIRKDKILLGLRSEQRKNYPGCWALPGGHIEKDETPMLAACREIHEELGINIITPTKLDIITDLRLNTPATFHIFSTNRWTGGEPRRRDEEHSKLKWFTAQEASHLTPLALDGYRSVFRRLSPGKA